jgi:ubiquinone/menaquinone biosynthesis C-methylase UbiE
MKRILVYIISKDYIVTEKNQEGIITEGRFLPYDLKVYLLIDKTKHLILEKGKYKITLKQNQKFINYIDQPGMMIVDNSREAYDQFWQNKQIVNKYLDEGRIKFYSDVFEKCKKHLKGTVVDIGCGSGDFLKIIMDNNIQCTVYGTDFSTGSIQRCKDFIQNGTFLVDDIYAMKLENNYFDVVICMEVLEHLEMPEIAFRELRRICKHDGLIIITIPNGKYDDYIGHQNFWSEEEFRVFMGHVSLIDFQYLEDSRTMLFVIRN